MLGERAKLMATDADSDQLKRIIETREKLADLKAEDVSLERTPWLFHSSSQIAPGFLSRQRFKIFTDLTNSAQPTNIGTSELSSALQAFQIESDPAAILVGTGDVLRWQRTEQLLLWTVNAKPTTSQVQYDRDPGQTGGRIDVAIPGE